MRERIKSFSDGGDSTTKKSRTGYAVHVWRQCGAWSQVVGVLLVRLAAIEHPPLKPALSYMKSTRTLTYYLFKIILVASSHFMFKPLVW
jgi:hypothetical protein